MPVEVIMPKVDMDMSHGTLAAWHVAEGESIAKGAALFDIETDKAAMEVESPASGRLHAVAANPGDRIAVGTVVALIYADGETIETGAPGTKPAPVAEPPIHEPAVVVANTIDVDIASNAVARGTVRATPAARAAARDAGLGLADVPGTGPLGRIQRDDVLALLDQQIKPLSAPTTWTPQTGPLHVSYRKGGGTPLVMFHGLTADSQSWAPLEKALGPDRALIRIDLPGHGRSPRRKLKGFADLARMVVEAFDNATRGFERVHVLGHSLGAGLAAATADIRSRRIASLSLIAPAGLGPEIDAAALNGIIRASQVESLVPWLRRMTAMPDGISEAYARAAMAVRADVVLRSAQAHMSEVLFPDGVQSFDLRPALSRLDIPVCIIWGRQDHILPMRQVLAADGEFAIHLLSGAGHIPQIECPDRVARILARHLVAAEAPV